MTASLDVQQTNFDDLIILRPRGDIDMSNVAALEGALRQASGRSAAAGRIVVDTTAIEFLSAAGMAALVQAQSGCDQKGLTFAVVASRHAVLRPLQVTGLDRQLNIVASLAAATAPAVQGAICRAGDLVQLVADQP